jgi:hypothetical protein
MRNKTLLIATLVLGLLALVALRSGREEAKPAETKQPLVDAALLSSLQSFVVKANGKTATIVKGADGDWTVKEKFGLPVDTETRLTPLVRSLQKASNHGLLTANPKRLEKLGLADTSLTLNTPGKSVTLEFGKQTDDGLGSSARFQGQPHAIRTDFTGDLDGNPASWVDLTLANAKAEEVKSIAFSWADGKKEFSRPAKGQPFGSSGMEGIENLVASLATLRVGEAVAKDDKEAAAAFAKSFEVRLSFFDGNSLTLSLGQIAGKSAGETPRTFVRAKHSDAKHKANSYATKAEFSLPAWIAEQIPASAAALAKQAQPPASPAALPSLANPAGK